MNVPIQLQQLPRRRKPAPLRRAFLWAAAALILAALAGAGYRPHGTAPTPHHTERVAAAAQRACPPGHVVDWLNEHEMQCLKELQ